MQTLVQIDALGHNGAYRACNRQTICDVAGAPIAELSLAPSLLVQRSLSALRKARTMPADERVATLNRAARLFATAAIGGMFPDAYRRVVSRVSGLPISVVRSATSIIAGCAAQAYEAAQMAMPQGAVNHWSDPATRSGRAVWTRRGDVFAVHAAGNHPGVHALWLEALALGYRVAVRPSSREPFTPYRLIAALREAGFGDDQVVLLPTEHAVADHIIDQADLALAYGGDDVVAKYAANTSVLPQGPGRSKILVAGEHWRDHLDVIADSVCREGGTACINATAVFVEDDPAGLAKALARRLAETPSLPPEDDNAVLPAQPLEAAQAIEKFLLHSAEGCIAHLGGDGIVHKLRDGGAVLRPAVFQLDRADAPQTGIELGFPCVWVAPWSPADGVKPLRNSLVVTVIGADNGFIESLVEEPSIANVYIGDHPTCWMRPGAPHDAYLGEFLMRTKAVVRG
jgi:acyl-CoA reductase-like NAD-dependent aldehyde dehydrogenase